MTGLQRAGARRVVGVVGVAVVGLAGPAWGGGPGERYYAVSWADGRMYEINPATLVGSQIASFGDASQSANAMTLDGLGRLLVMSAKNGRADQIATFDPATNQYLPLRLQTDLINVRGLAMSPAGELLAVNHLGMYSIDRTTGLSTLVAPTPGPTQGLGYGPDGALYATGSDGLDAFLKRYTPGVGWTYVGNPAPGTFSFILQTLFTGPDQTLMAARATGLTSNTLYRLDHLTGQVLSEHAMSLTGISPIDIRGMEFVPTPGALGALVGGVLIVARRRRTPCATRADH
jgi:hypothetical protein